MTDRTDGRSSAEVIPFSRRPVAPIDAAARLEQALRGLDRANAELRDNIAVWRRVTQALTVSLDEITENLQGLHLELTRASSQLLQTSVEEPDVQ